jgi:hypothetical protein
MSPPDSLTNVSWTGVEYWLGVPVRSQSCKHDAKTCRCHSTELRGHARSVPIATETDLAGNSGGHVKRTLIMLSLGALAALGIFSATAIAGSASTRDTTTTTTTTSTSTPSTSTTGTTGTTSTTATTGTTSTTVLTTTVTTTVTTNAATTAAGTTTVGTTTTVPHTGAAPPFPGTDCGIGGGQGFSPWFFRVLLLWLFHHRHHHGHFSMQNSTLDRGDPCGGFDGSGGNGGGTTTTTPITPLVTTTGTTTTGATTTTGTVKSQFSRFRTNGNDHHHGRGHGGGR